MTENTNLSGVQGLELLFLKIYYFFEHFCHISYRNSDFSENARAFFCVVLFFSSVAL